MMVKRKKMPSTPFHVASVGDLVVDLVFTIPSLPIMPEQIQMAQGPHTEPGGAGNFLITGARLGLTMHALGSLGDDIYGHEVAQILAQEGVDTSGIAHAAGSTSTLVLVFVDEAGQHAFWEGDAPDYFYILISGRIKVLKHSSQGKEVIIEAMFMGEPGHAFTNMPGHFGGRIEDLLTMPLKNNFERAVFVAALNAILRKAGIAAGTAHCKDEDPVKCVDYLQDFIDKSTAKPPRIFQIGYQPRMAEFLAERYDLRLTDMDPDNIGKEVNGVKIEPPENLWDNMEWCDVVFATGSTFVNDTAEDILSSGKPSLFYGVSCAGVAALLQLPRFCPLGR